VPQRFENLNLAYYGTGESFVGGGGGRCRVVGGGGGGEAYFFEGYGLSRSETLCAVDLSVGSFADLFDSAVVCYGACEWGVVGELVGTVGEVVYLVRWYGWWRGIVV